MSDDEDERNRVWAVAENIIRTATAHYPSLGEDRPFYPHYREYSSELTGKHLIECFSTHISDDGELFTFSEYHIEERDETLDTSYLGEIAARSLWFETKAWNFTLYVVEAAEADDARILVIRNRPSAFDHGNRTTKPMMRFQRSTVTPYGLNAVFVDFQGDVSELEAAMISLSI